MLIENNELYDRLEHVCRAMYNSDYVFVHAIYEPDEDGQYHAAVDLNEEGETYHVYFVCGDDGGLYIRPITRWYMG